MDVKEVGEDDASVSVHLWDDRLIYTYPGPSMLEVKYRQCLCIALNKFNNLALRIWFQSV